MMGKNGYEDDTDYISSFTTDKDYVSKYPDGETEFISYGINVGSVIPKSKKQKRIESVILKLKELKSLTPPESFEIEEYDYCIKQLKKCTKE
jgi:maleate cis-trans isomerase